MFIADQPASPPVVMVVPAGTAQPAAVSKPYAIGVCEAVSTTTGQSRVTPITWAQQSLAFHNEPVKDGSLDEATVRVIQPPQHGKLAVHDELGDWTTEITDWRDTEYVPDDNYEGSDSLIMQVEGGGYTVQVHYFYSVGAFGTYGVAYGKSALNPECKDKSGLWSISAAFSQAQGADDLYSLSGFPFSGYQLKNVDVSLNFANLANGAVGETTGHNITLDDDGAGHGWFIDSTPQDNSEFLPTSNPNEFIAKAGSDAAGKMDLLTVLLHEYGHALDLDHSADMHDFMAAELQPGVRRTVSDADMA